jgi:acetaldehyde dehydrogenase (acetylating)
LPESAAPNLQADVDRFEAATDQAIAACCGNARDAVKALIVANE